MTHASELKRIALVGFGEAGSILGEELVKRGCEVAMYDILLDAPESRGAISAKAERVGVRVANSLRELISGSSSSGAAHADHASSASREVHASDTASTVGLANDPDVYAGGSASARAKRAGNSSNSDALSTNRGAHASDKSRHSGQHASSGRDTRPQLIISAVTAASSATVASQAAGLLTHSQIFLDINSVSPTTKRANAQAVEGSGADYVEAAVMAPVPPQRLAVPMLLGGRKAAMLAETLRALGMNTTAIAEEIGIASAVKMCRSIVIKGLEALTVECMLAARQFGAEQQVLTSLHNSFPHMGWSTHLPDYLVSRVAEHGRRRAAEMREVARTLQDIDMQPIMASAIAERQAWLVDQMAEHGIQYPQGEPFSWRTLADALCKR
jgi:3-hydroxyisobutyrate dehydrogenase-like beta-hydroxyacid dehydrogenase